MKRLILVINILMVWFFSNGQGKNNSNYPEVGKPCPNFILRNIKYFPKQQAVLKEFSGKWLILDFWAKWCGTCVESFPHINEMQKEFDGKVVFIMIGKTDENSNDIKAIYAKYREKQKLVMPCSFDTLLFSRFDIDALPYIIVIDDKGIVRAITSKLNSGNLKDLMAGKMPALVKQYRKNESSGVFSFDPDKPFLINENGGYGTSFLYRSIITNWEENMRESAPINISSQLKDGSFQALGVPLNSLYLYAYAGTNDVNSTDRRFGPSLLGKFFPVPILELRDSSIFRYGYSQHKNLFCYSLFMSTKIANIEVFKSTMQNDVHNTFGYDVRIETRRLPYCKLVATADAKRNLKAKGDSTYAIGFRAEGNKLKNMPIENLMVLIRHYSGIDYAIIDETGIEGNIDLDLSDCILTDLECFKQLLHKNGLDLVQAEKEMECLVIRDSKPENH